MAKLTAKKRKKIPSDEFGLPKERKYPIENKAHARNAKARAAQEFAAGRLTKAEKDRIDRKADAMLKSNSK